MPTTPALFVSGYTREGYGAGPGVVRFELLADGAVGEQLAHSIAVTNPSFMADAGEVLFAVEELKNGNVVALDPQSLEVVGRASSGGADSCHVAVVDDSVWVANYSSGTAGVLSAAGIMGAGANLVAEAAPVEPVILYHPGSGPVPDRQGESHAHQATATMWGTVLVSDLGADRVDEYSADSHIRIGSAELPPGTGPRHIAIKDQYLIVAGELDGHVHVLQRALVARSGDALASGDHFWRWLFKVPLAETAQEITEAEEFFPSHIELSADGTLLYAAVRGPNTVVVLDVTGLPNDQSVRSIASAPKFLHQVPSGGQWPRHFALSSSESNVKKLYVANQHSDHIAVFDLDEQGLPGTEPVQRVEFGSPACIVLRS
ncbi:lactonase family protein [Arthrobacter sp. Sr24]